MNTEKIIADEKGRTQQMSIRIEHPLRKRLEAYARHKGLSKADAARRLLDQHLPSQTAVK